MNPKNVLFRNLYFTKWNNSTDRMNFNKLAINVNKAKRMLFSFGEYNFSPFIKLNGVSVRICKNIWISGAFTCLHHFKTSLLSRLNFLIKIIFVGWSFKITILCLYFFRISCYIWPFGAGWYFSNLYQTSANSAK